jgi:hypothetical protein
MTNQISKPKMGIPIAVKIFSWILIFAGCFYFYVYTFNPSISFPNANLNSYSAKIGFESTGVRILGSVLAILISLINNKPHWLFITLISRIFIELGDIIVGLIHDGVNSNTFALILLIILEIWAVLQLWSVMITNKKRMKKIITPQG